MCVVYPECMNDICSTAQGPLAAEGWLSAKQRLANKSITLPLCRWELQIWNSKRWWSHGKAASGKLVWNQQYLCCFQTSLQLCTCHIDDDIFITAQAPLATEGWQSGMQRLDNRLITLLLWQPRPRPWQITYSWLQFNSGAMPLGDKPKQHGCWEL